MFPLVGRNEKLMSSIESCPQECGSLCPDTYSLRRRIEKRLRGEKSRERQTVEAGGGER